jgi:hypothetical protein
MPTAHMNCLLINEVNMLEIKAIGIGGIGCALLPFLCR